MTLFKKHIIAIYNIKCGIRLTNSILMLRCHTIIKKLFIKGLKVIVRGVLFRFIHFPFLNKTFNPKT